MNVFKLFETKNSYPWRALTQMVQQGFNLKKRFFFSHSLVASTMHSSNDTGKYLGKFYRLSVLVVLAVKLRKAFMENHRAPMEVFCDKPITCT